MFPAIYRSLQYPLLQITRIMPKKASQYRHYSIPSTVKVIVLGTANKNGSHSVIIDTNQISYLVNCGEGTTRVINESKGSKIGNIRHVFFTSDSWKNVSGLQGLAISLNSVGIDELTLHAGKSIFDFVLMQKRFLDSATCRILRSPIHETNFSDLAFCVDSIPILPSQTTSEEPDSKKPRFDLELEKCYALLFKSVLPPPKISISKCREAGIPDSLIKSPIMANFKKHKPVELSDGKIIQPEQVLVYNNPYKPFLIFECPSVNHISSFLENPQLRSLCDEKGSQQLDLVVHLSPEEVISNPLYQDLINMFRITSLDDEKKFTTQQLIVNSTGSCCSTFKFFHSHVVRHEFLDAQIFPISTLALPESSASTSSNDDQNQTTTANIVTDLPDVVQGQPLMKFFLRPSRGFDLSSCNHLSKEEILRIHTDKIEKELLSDCNFITESFAKLQKELVDLPGDRNSRPYPRITILGTGSAYSSSFRNSSGILLEVSADSCLLVDCGEGTFNQIEHIFGQKRTVEILTNLKLICITHLHLDHHAGLYTILYQREKIRLNLEKEHGVKISSVGILAPYAMKNIGMTYDQLFNTDVFQQNQLYITTSLCNMENELFEDFIWFSEYSSILDLLGIKIRPVYVKHTNSSYGYVMSGSSMDTSVGESLPWKIVFSGDCLPSPALVTHGKNCDLLIHEATFEEGLENMARLKSHSTVAQAVNIGQEMNAKYTLLTHFSQRYGKLPYITKHYPNVGAAFDFTQITLNDMPRLCAMLPYLQHLHPVDFLNMSKRSERKDYAERRLREEADNEDSDVDGDIRLLSRKF